MFRKSKKESIGRSNITDLTVYRNFFHSCKRSLACFFLKKQTCMLTLCLPTPKVISLCHQYRVRPVCTSVQSDQALYFWQTNLYTPKFGMVRVNIEKNKPGTNQCEQSYSPSFDKIVTHFTLILLIC